MREYEIYSGFKDKIWEIILEISLWGDQIHLNKKNSLDITVILKFKIKWNYQNLCLPYFHTVPFRFHLLASGAAFTVLNSASSGRHQ